LTWSLPTLPPNPPPPEGATINATSGEFTWPTDEDDGPASGGSGVFIIDVRVTDGYPGSKANFTQVNITVNEAPVANAGLNATVFESDLVTLDGTLSSDFEDGSNVQFFWNQTGGVTVTDSFDPTLGIIQITAPQVGSSGGNFTFTLNVTDSAGATNTDDVTITVNNVNGRPQADDQTIAGNEDSTGIVFTLTGSDPDGNELILFTVITPPTNGTITSYYPLNGTGTYVPLANNNGFPTDFFEFTVTDDSGLLNTESLPGNVTVNITPVNDEPEAEDDFYSVAQGGTLSVNAPGVLTNDNDIDLDSLTAIEVSSPSNSISFTLNVDGSFNYTPNPAFSGQDSFTYNATDGTANSNTVTATINVIATPSVVSITASGGGAPGLDNGDQTIITFSDNTNTPPVFETTDLNALFTFNQSGNTVSFGTTTSSVWQTSSILVITTTDATIPPGFFTPVVGTPITISKNSTDLTNSAGTSDPFTNSTVNVGVPSRSSAIAEIITCDCSCP